MKILITGGAGFIGSHITEELIKKNKIVIVDNLSTGYKKLLPKNVKFYKLDIKKTSNLKKIINNEKIEIIIHLAAKLSLQEAQRRPKMYFKNNVEGTKSVLNAMNNSEVKAFIFSSTAAIYSGNKKIKCKETLSPRPTNLYGKTKFLGEKMIKKFCKNKKIKYVILRYFNVVGSSSSGKIGPIKNYGQLFKILSIKALKKNPRLNIYGKNHKTLDGTCIRDFIDINDIVQIHKFFLRKLNQLKDNGVVINCGYGRGYSILDVIGAFEKVIRKKIRINFLKKRKGEISNIYADNSLIRKKFKWKPKNQNLIVSVKRCLNWEKKLNNV
tara:strand:+ start:2778 stop:3755 length:978 start_codon:yes stop_codon:yes gene_type:complete